MSFKLFVESYLIGQQTGVMVCATIISVSASDSAVMSLTQWFPKTGVSKCFK